MTGRAIFAEVVLEDVEVLVGVDAEDVEAFVDVEDAEDVDHGKG